MSINHKLKIEKIEVIEQKNNLNKIAVKIHWHFYATEGKYNHAISGKTKLDEPNSSEFIKYEDLSEEQIIEWINPRIDWEKVYESLESAFNHFKKLDELKESELPWS